MSLLQEREYYKPFNYPWAFEHYKTQQHMHWLPDEVPLADDLKDLDKRIDVGGNLPVVDLMRVGQRTQSQTPKLLLFYSIRP